MSTEAKPRQRERYRGFEEIGVPIVVRVGGLRMTFGDLSELAGGTVLTLDARVGSPFELLAGGDPIARVDPVASDSNEGIALKLVADSEGESNDDAAS